MILCTKSQPEKNTAKRVCCPNIGYSTALLMHVNYNQLHEAVTSYIVWVEAAAVAGCASWTSSCLYILSPFPINCSLIDPYTSQLARHVSQGLLDTVPLYKQPWMMAQVAPQGVSAPSIQNAVMFCLIKPMEAEKTTWLKGLEPSVQQLWTRLSQQTIVTSASPKQIPTVKPTVAVTAVSMLDILLSSSIDAAQHCSQSYCNLFLNVLQCLLELLAVFGCCIKLGLDVDVGKQHTPWVCTAALLFSTSPCHMVAEQIHDLVYASTSCWHTPEVIRSRLQTVTDARHRVPHSSCSFCSSRVAELPLLVEPNLEHYSCNC